MLRMCSCVEGETKFLLFKKKILVLKTSQQRVVKGTWASSQPVAAHAVTHPEA